MTLWTLLGRRASRDAGRPLVTYLDLESRERMELSAASLANAAAKTAGLLRDDLEVEPGDEVGVDLPLHWQLPVAIAALDAVGALALPWAQPGAARIAVVPAAASAAWPVPVVMSLAPFGLPDPAGLPPDAAPDAVDHAVAARMQPDSFIADAEIAASDPAVRIGNATLDGSEVVERAAALAGDLRVSARGRLLVADSPERDPLRTWLACLAVPLVADAAVVLVRHPTSGDVRALMAAEGITAVEEQTT